MFCCSGQRTIYSVKIKDLRSRQSLSELKVCELHLPMVLEVLRKHNDYVKANGYNRTHPTDIQERMALPDGSQDQDRPAV